MIRLPLTIVTGARTLPPLDPGCDLDEDVGRHHSDTAVHRHVNGLGYVGEVG
jgi:hypothetical protein